MPGRFRFPFSRERESAAGFHSRRLASPRLASAADRGRHFHEDRRDASQKPRETVLVCHAARDGRRVRLASVIERRAICSGKVIYASAAYDRFPRSARSPEDREEEEEEEKEERIRVRTIFNRYTFSTWSEPEPEDDETENRIQPTFQSFRGTLLRGTLRRVSFEYGGATRCDLE